MVIQQRVLKFVVWSNWIILVAAAIASLAAASPAFTGGVITGGLIVTVNFHLLARTLKKALAPPYLASHNVVLAKYYLRFTISGIIIFVLLAGRFVDAVGLVLGLSVVVASIMLATLREIINLIFKETV